MGKKNKMTDQELYLSWVNDFLTVERFAEHYGMSVIAADALIERERLANNRRTQGLKMNKGLGEMLYISERGVFCKKYVGKFNVQKLQDKADTGLWYSGIQGNPHAVEGEGATPLDAVRDSIARTSSLMRQMRLAVSRLDDVSPSFCVESDIEVPQETGKE